MVQRVPRAHVDQPKGRGHASSSEVNPSRVCALHNENRDALSRVAVCWVCGQGEGAARRDRVQDEAGGQEWGDSSRNSPFPPFS